MTASAGIPTGPGVPGWDPPPSVDDRLDLLEANFVSKVIFNRITASNVPGGTLAAIGAQITVAPAAATTPEGVARIALIPNDATANLQNRTAIIAFHPDREYIEDATIKAHRHVNGSDVVTDRHIQIHTKKADGSDLTSRLEIQYRTDDAYILVTSAHLEFDDNAYMQVRNAGQMIVSKSPIRRESASGDTGIRFKQTGDGLSVDIGRIASGQALAIRPATGSDAVAGLNIEKADGSDIFAIEASGIPSLPVAGNHAASAIAGGVQAVPATVAGYFYIRDSGGTLRKVPYFA